MSESTTQATVLINLGSPDSCSIKDVRKYLAEFLMDPYVIDVPWLLRALIVYGTILPARPKNTAEAYASIWTKDGSPLITTSKELTQLVQTKVKQPLVLAMRYGNPSIFNTLKNLLQTYPNLQKIFVVPLYPHYAMSSTETVIQQVNKVLEHLAPRLEVVFQPPFFEDPNYIQALSNSMKPYVDQPFDHLLFSYHGLPERHLRKSDPTKQHCLSAKNCCDTPSPAHQTCYRAQVYRTTQKVTQSLGLPENKYSVAFQSRLGRDPWIQPYTDVELETLPHKGVENLLVVCPAFVSDCLETLEEIEERGREIFLHSGGKSFTMIPCLNTHPDWVATLATWINSQ